MEQITPRWLLAFWSAPEFEINAVVFLNLLGALMLGLILGYERSYHGRAAGMRTYGLVCAASAGLVVFVGYPTYWYGGHMGVPGTGDPTRVVQGIVTGIGFLGAGVIMKEGLNISGLTTAASIWASSVIGILVGVGFYGAAILLTLLSASLMMWGSLIEGKLPSRPAVGMTLCFADGHEPSEMWLRDIASRWGYQIAGGTMAITGDNSQIEWRFVAVAMSRNRGISLAAIAAELRSLYQVERFQLSHARN